jgi:hypothetical protein
MVKGKDFRMAHVLKRAIYRSDLSQTALGFPHGLSQAEISRYMRHPFGPRVRDKIIKLGESLGISSDQCVRSVRGA